MDGKGREEKGMEWKGIHDIGSHTLDFDTFIEQIAEGKFICTMYYTNYDVLFVFTRIMLTNFVYLFGYT